MKRLVLLAMLLVLGCHSPTEATKPLLQGWWTTTTGWGMHVQPNTVTVSNGCFVGTFATPRLNSDGAFVVVGTFGVHGGPPPPSGVVTDAPARFLGASSGDLLSLRVEPQNGAVVGPLVFGFDGAQPGHPISPPCP